MHAWILVRDGYVDTVFVGNDAIKPARLERLKVLAEKAGMDLYESTPEDVSELASYLAAEIADRDE